MKALLAAIALALPVLGAEVSGYVYAVDGRPVEGATVRAGSASVTTDKDGAFALKNLPDGVIELDVEAKGGKRARPLALPGDVVSVMLAEEEPAVVPLSLGTGGDGIIRGRITLDGKPLANAPVVVGGEEARVLTNAKGEYVATGLGRERHTVSVDQRLLHRVRAPYGRRAYAAGQEPFIADLTKAAEGTVNLELESAPMVRGRVTDADGKPVARARVQIAIAARSTLDFARDPNTSRTTPDGRYALPVPEWLDNEPLSVFVTPLLHSTVRSKPFDAGGADRVADITLPKFETVRIRVLDRAGKPVPHARVGFATTADVGMVESAMYLVEFHFEKTTPRVNAEGELVLQLAADMYDFAAAADGFQTAAINARTIAKPATVDITLERAALLRGRVHRGGQGVPQVNVNILGLRNTHVTTNSDGKFEIKGLAPGTYRLTFFKEDELIDRTLEVEAPGEVDLPLPATGTLRGRVVDARTGQPVSEFTYSIEPAQPNPQARHSAGMHRGHSSPDGTFTLTIPAGSYRITAGASGYLSEDAAEARVVENETTTVELPLGRGITITGRVVDESGLPVGEADVMVTAAEPERMRARRAARVGPPHTKTAEDGTFTVTGIEPGQAQLAVRSQGYVSHRRTFEAERDMPVEITLARGLTLQGVVVRGGKRVAGAQVGAVSAAVGGEHQSAITDEDGRFTLSGLIPARYTVSAFLEEQHTEVRDVDPARPRELVLSLDPKARGVLYGVVTGMPSTAGKYTRRMVMVHTDDDAAEGAIDDAGNYRIENAPTGTVSAMAVVETSAGSARTSAKREIELAPGQPQRLDLDLGGTLRVSGRVTVDGKPARAAEVGFTSQDGTMAHTRTRDDGAYEVLLATAGTYSIYARATQLDGRAFHTVRQVRGGDTIDIDLREQTIEGTVVDAHTRQPIEGAMVTLAPPAMTSITAEVPTDASGRFSVVTAIGGPLRLIASAGGYAQRTMAVSSAAQHYAFELVPVPDFTVRVLDKRNGTPLEAHLVFADETGILTMRPRRSADGTTYHFSVAPGKYRVIAVVQGFPQKTVEVTAPGAVEILVE